MLPDGADPKDVVPAVLMYPRQAEEEVAFDFLSSSRRNYKMLCKRRRQRRYGTTIIRSEYD